MAETIPRKIAYLFGAGATHAELANLVDAPDDEKFFKRRGLLIGNVSERVIVKASLLLAYFIPGYRHVAALVMGASLLNPKVFAKYAYTGALIWSGSFIGLGYIAGEEWNQLFPILHRTVIAVIIVVLFALGSVIALVLMRRTPR